MPQLDGIHEREIADGPREGGSLGVAGAAQEEGGGGEIKDIADTELAFDGFNAGNPEAGNLAVLFGLVLFYGVEFFIVAGAGGRDFVAVAVVGLVIDDEKVFQTHEVGHDAMSMAMTVVLPTPVASLRAMRKSEPRGKCRRILTRPPRPGGTLRESP